MKPVMMNTYYPGMYQPTTFLEFVACAALLAAILYFLNKRFG